MLYQEMLFTPTWKTIRHEVFRRDNYKCIVCGKQHKIFRQETYGQYLNRLYPGSNEVNDILGLYYLKSIEAEVLQVHHKVYRTNEMPILQSIDDLQTVCSTCHEKIHDEIPINVVDHNNVVVDKAEVCSRCNGTGFIEKYRKIQGGICFQCNGDRYILPQKYMIWTADDVKYPGVTHNLSITSQELDRTIIELSNIPESEYLNAFLDKTQALIENFNLSAYDERFLIMFPPFPYDDIGKNSLKVRIGKTTYLSLPRPTNSKSFHVLSGITYDWEPDDIWERLNDIKQELNNDLLDCYIPDPSTVFFYSHDFKQQQSYVLYKAAVDRDFRIQLFKYLEKSES